MFREACITAAVGPLFTDSAQGIAKYVHAMMLDAKFVAPLFFDFVNPVLSDPRPDTQNISVIVDFQR